jgi:hypothetical protein
MWKQFHIRLLFPVSLPLSSVTYADCEYGTVQFGNCSTFVWAFAIVEMVNRTQFLIPIFLNVETGNRNQFLTSIFRECGNGKQESISHFQVRECGNGKHETGTNFLRMPDSGCLRYELIHTLHYIVRLYCAHYKKNMRALQFTNMKRNKTIDKNKTRLDDVKSRCKKESLKTFLKSSCVVYCAKICR